MPLTAETMIPLGLALTLITALVAGTWAVASKLNSILLELQAIRAELNQTVKKDDFSQWLLDLKEDNPDLKVPSIRK